MKKLITLSALCLSIIIARAQQTTESKDFKIYSISVNNQMQKFSQDKNYAAASNLIKEWIAKFDKESPEVKKDFAGNLGGMYYNLVCYDALQGKKADAITEFQKAVTLGYTDYQHILVDTDLDGLRKDKQFIAIMQDLKEKKDFGYILQNSGPYNLKEKTTALPAFTYEDANSPNLVSLKNRFNLDSVSGNGDEISKVKNLLHWTHNAVRHDGNSGNPKSKNAIDLIAVCKKENRGVNCRMMATILRDVYQSEGFKTRIVTCMPKDTADFDCHVITVVWLNTLNKWVWMDPTFNAYVSDDKGNLLNIEEVRNRLVNGGALVLNEDANWNNKNKQTKAFYLDNYMSKNLYWLECSAKSAWDVETRKPGMQTIEYLNLYPGTYSTIHQPVKKDGDMIEYATNNPAYFWQKPTDLNQ